jgi:hypothetical protein
MSHDAGFHELAAWLRGQEAQDNAETMLKELNAFGLTA